MRGGNRTAIVGASGFIGRALVKHLAEHGPRPIGIVRSLEGARRVREAGGEVRQGLLTDPAFLRRALEGCAAVVYLAGTTREARPGEFWEVHVRGVENCLDAARRAGVRHFVHFSGLGVAGYGSRPELSNEYFRTKREAERRVAASGISHLILRPSYILGSGDNVTSVLAGKAESGEIVVRGDGSYRLQPVALDDVVRLVARVLAARMAGAWDVVGPEPVAYRELLERLLAALWKAGRLKSRPKMRRVPLGELGGLSPEERDILTCDQVGDAGPMARAIGPLTPLDEALRKALE